MAKSSGIFFCQDCGNEQTRWTGQCPGCGAWNSLIESTKVTGQKKKSKRATPVHAQVERAVVRASDVTEEQTHRIRSGSEELDRVLGGGLVQGSVVLIGGDPGIGKSTLLTQVATHLGQSQAILYVSGEESLSQISQRATRLELPLERLWLYSSNDLEEIEQLAYDRQVNTLVVDSIQTIASSYVESTQGSVAQVRECCSRLVNLAKTTNTIIFIVGHVTKEGTIAGPRMLEHMVDVVLYFEGDQGGRFRAVRAIKNRFGAVNELGVFAMTEQGLKQVKNPSALFLSDRAVDVSGNIVTVACEGSRPLLLEVQTLVDTCLTGMPRRISVGVDTQRLAMLLAILNRHGGVACGDKDIFINVPGGIKLQETSVDLAILLALASSAKQKIIPAMWAAIGEVGLSGEVRPVLNGELRVREAAKQGFTTIILPKSNQVLSPPKGLNIIPVGHLKEAIKAVL